MAIKIEKNFGVVVLVKGQKKLKQFDTEEEVKDFCHKLDAHQEVEYEIIEKQLKGIAGRENSKAFVKVPAKNVKGGFTYKCIPVRPRKGFLFCINCHDYKKFIKETDEYGSVFNCCPECGLPDTDAHMKTANNLW